MYMRYYSVVLRNCPLMHHISFFHHTRVLNAGRECAIAYKTQLEFVHKIILKPTGDLKAKLPVFSREVAVSVNEIVKTAGELKELGGFVDMTDPQIRAEHELLAAAAAIEAAAKKLSELVIPRTVSTIYNVHVYETIH